MPVPHSNDQADAYRARALADPAAELFGSWTYQAADGRLSWSDSLFGLFGFAVGEVMPTLALMSSHQHPHDRVRWDGQLRQTLTGGTTASVWHRVIDAQQRERTMHTVLSAVRDGGGAGAQVYGVMTDFSARLAQDRAEAAREAVAKAAQSRGVIDQAKGIIMAILNVDEQAAFDLLRWHSSHLNVKLRDVAAAVVRQRAELTQPASAMAPGERLRTVVTGLAPARQPTLVPSRSVSSAPADVDADREAARTNRIPPSALPATMLRAVSGAAQSISIADCTAADQPLVYVNRAFEMLTGYSAEQILGRNCRFLQGPAPIAESESAAVAELRRAIAEGRENRTVIRNYRQDGSAFWNELHLSAVRDAAGAVTHYIGYQSDVTERVEREQQLEHLAFHDPRTNLPNQAAATAYLNSALRPGDGTHDQSALRIHLSGFRAADGSDDPLVVRSVLATAAQRLQAALPPPAYLAKLDDDAFLAVSADAAAVHAAAKTLAQPTALTDGHIEIRVRVEPHTT